MTQTRKNTGRFTDPIAYQLAIRVLTPESCVPFLLQSFAALLESTKDAVMRLIAVDPNDALNDITNGSTLADPSVYGGNPFRLLQQAADMDDWEQEWDRFVSSMSNMLDYPYKLDRIAQPIVYFHNNSKKNFSAFNTPKTPFAGEMMAVFNNPAVLNDVIKAAVLSQNAGGLPPVFDPGSRGTEYAGKAADLLSCPDPWLKDVRVPAGWIQPCYHLKMVFSRLTMVAQEDVPKLSGPVPKVAARVPEQWRREGFYEYGIFLQIPRVLFSDNRNGFMLQPLWTRVIKDVCGRYPFSVATFCMDAMTQDAAGRLSCLVPLQETRTYYSPQIPAAAWRMFLNKDQVQLLGGPQAIAQSGVFYRVEALGNGGCFTQLSDNVQHVPKPQNDALFSFLRPYLPDGRGGMEMAFSDFSFRLSLRPEDIDLLSPPFTGRILLRGSDA